MHFQLSLNLDMDSANADDTKTNLASNPDIHASRYAIPDTNVVWLVPASSNRSFPRNELKCLTRLSHPSVPRCLQLPANSAAVGRFPPYRTAMQYGTGESTQCRGCYGQSWDPRSMRLKLIAASTSEPYEQVHGDVIVYRPKQTLRRARAK